MASNGRQRKITAPSSELGHGDFGITYNASGRPMRQVRKSNPPSLESAVASGEESESESDVPVRKSRGTKRKRSPSPPMSETGNDGHIASSSDREEDELAIVPRRRRQTTTLTPRGGSSVVKYHLHNVNFTIPVGHVGPLHLMISPDDGTVSVEANDGAPLPKVPSPRRSRGKSARKAAPAPSSTKTQRAGFLDLPAEIRNEIYRMILVAPTRLNFAAPVNFGRSAALLRTCRQVHGESRSILYSENVFFFNRRTSRYGSFWEDDWRELGFKSVRHFTKTIGETNLSLIRHLNFQFEDATPCLNPEKMSHDDRRFVNDDFLISILRILGDHAQLESLDLTFHGRRRVETSDSRFLDSLKRIKADIVSFVKYPIGRGESCYSTESKQEDKVRTALMKAMVRTRKLYD